MVSIASVLQILAILLVFGNVHCDHFVGHGKHKLDGEKITKLNGNTMIAKNETDIKRYKELDGSCDVTMENGSIILWYEKDSNTMRDGCSVDFVTKKEGQILLEFGIQDNGNLAGCISKSITYELMLFSNYLINKTDNMLSFAYSLKDYEFDQIKDGPKESYDSECNDKVNCKGDKCLNTKAFYSITWRKWLFILISEYHFPYYINAFGKRIEIGNLIWIKNDKHLYEAKGTLKLMIEGGTFVLSNEEKLNISAFCDNMLYKPEEWNIVDENYSNDENFTNLFTFHIIPVNAIRKTMKIFLTCSENDTRENCKNDTLIQKCDRMFIKFDKEHYKLLVPPIPPTTEITTTTSRKQRTRSTRRPKSTVESKTKDSGNSGIIIITISLIIVGIIIFPLLIICLLIWFFVFRGKDKEEKPKELEAYFGTTDFTQSSKTTKSVKTVANSVKKDPATVVDKQMNKAKDDLTTVVQTQYDRFGDAETVVETQMDQNMTNTEDSKIKADVSVIKGKKG